MTSIVKKENQTLPTAIFNAKSVVITLEKLMNQVTKEDCSPKTVNAACNCAARITDIIRLHIESEKLKGR